MIADRWFKLPNDGNVEQWLRRTSYNGSVTKAPGSYEAMFVVGEGDDAHHERGQFASLEEAMAWVEQNAVDHYDPRPDPLA